MLAVPMPLANGAKIGTLAIVLIALSFAAAEDRTRKAATDMHAPFIDKTTHFYLFAPTNHLFFFIDCDHRHIFNPAVKVCRTVCCINTEN